MKCKQPFVLRRWAEGAGGTDAGRVIRTYVDDEGRTIKVFDARYAAGAASRQTVKPKGTGRKKAD